MANHVGGDGHTPVVDMRVNERRKIDGLLPDERPRPFLMMFHESTFDVREGVEPFFPATVFLAKSHVHTDFAKANSKNDVFYYTGICLRGGSGLCTWCKEPIHPSDIFPCRKTR